MKKHLPLTLCLLSTSFSALAQDDQFARLNALVQQANAARGNLDPNAQQALAALAAQAGSDTSQIQAPSGNDSSAPQPPTLRSQAFKQFLDKTYPLTPEQILEMHRLQDQAQQAAQTSAVTPPKPVSSTQTLDLSPGVLPPVVRLATGFVSSLVFVDATGQAWPIADYSIGNPKSFNIQWDKKTNSLFVQSTTPYVTGNLAVRLANLDTPVMISLVTGQKEIDYRVDLQVRGRGPNAIAPVGGQELPSPVSNNLLSILDGVPPSGSQELEVSQNAGRAWLHHGKLLFRTQLTVLSPAWSASVSSPDGTHVYELAQTPLILASQNGKPIKIELRGL